MNSTHKVEVVRLGEVKRHPDADSLEYSNVFGYSVVFKENQYKSGDLVAFVPPDNVMPQTDEYSWLGPSRRVKAKKLRGIPSFGLLLKAPDWATEGQDLTSHFGVTHYDPPVVDPSNQGEDEAAPKLYAPTYDLESFNKYHKLFQDGELVNVFEKLEGENERVVFSSEDQKLHVGSHYRWKKDSELNTFWRSVRFTPGIEDFCRAYPDYVVIGESVGKVKGFDYAVPKGQTRIFVFDIFHNGKFLDFADAKRLTDPFELVWAPLAAENYPFNFEEICKMGEEKTRVKGAKHISEGVVVSPVKERYDFKVGRVKLKYKSVAYLERSK